MTVTTNDPDPGDNRPRWLVVAEVKKSVERRTYGPFFDHAEAERCVTALAANDPDLDGISIDPHET